jgi:CubicO group peptidase (beta-lactamase class C family)
MNLPMAFFSAEHCAPLGTVLVFACASLCAFVPATGLGADFGQLMTDARVPGLAIAVIRDGGVADTTVEGARNVSTGTVIDEHTVFSAASLSKPVFAYAVLQLVDAGRLSLDAPLARYVPDVVRDDPRAAAITVRHALSHTTGLPNWRSKERPLKTYFPPGERFSYSGEGIVWLQRVVETITGQSLERVARRLVFGPLQMRDTSFTWRPAFDRNHADPHDDALKPGSKRKPTDPNAAYSLQTTAADYARFLQAVLGGARLKPATARLWLDPHVRIRRDCYQCLDDDVPETDQRVAWGLGWGLEPDGGTFFHWGDNGPFKAFALGSVATRSAVVVFSNGANGMSIMADVVDRLMPGDHPAFDWLGYPRYRHGVQ